MYRLSMELSSPMLILRFNIIGEFFTESFCLFKV